VPCTADLSDTVNLWGAPPAALAALRAAGPETVSTYRRCTTPSSGRRSPRTRGCGPRRS
jgi:hypothetical protein